MPRQYNAPDVGYLNESGTPRTYLANRAYINDAGALAWSCDGSSACEFTIEAFTWECGGRSAVEWDWWAQERIFEWALRGTLLWTLELWRCTGSSECEWMTATRPATGWNADGEGGLQWYLPFGASQGCTEGDGEFTGGVAQNYVF